MRPARALAQTKVDIDAGRLRHGPRRTVTDLAAEWLDAVQPNRKASTFSNYGWLMRAYVVPRIGRVRLDRLSPADVQKLYSELRASGGRDGTPLTGTQVRNIHRVLHNALNYAVRLGYIAHNPTEAVDKPREDTEERTVYTPEQIRRFLAAVEGDRLQAMWYLVLATGLRRAELAGLRWRDVALDREPPTLAVRTTRTTAGHQVVEHDPKSRSSRRVLHLDRGTADVLRRHRAAMTAEAELREEHALGDYVFVDEFGDPFHPARLTRDLHSLQRRARSARNFTARSAAYGGHHRPAGRGAPQGSERAPRPRLDPDHPGPLQPRTRVDADGRSRRHRAVSATGVGRPDIELWLRSGRVCTVQVPFFGDGQVQGGSHVADACQAGRSILG